MKGGVLRGWARFLDRRGMLDAIKAAVPAETAQLLEHPPLASEWVPIRHTIAVVEAVAARAGKSRVREMNHEGLRTTLLAMAMPILSGLGRIFGLQPATIYGRLELILKSSSRGFQFGYESLSDHSGIVLVHSGAREESMCTAEAWAAGFDLLLEVCGVTGDVVVKDVTPNANGATLRFLVDWRRKRGAAGPPPAA